MDKFIKVIDLKTNEYISFIDESLNIAKKENWTKHLWSNYQSVIEIENKKELQVQIPSSHLTLKKWRFFINQLLEEYLKTIDFSLELYAISDVRYNKYEKGTEMRPHFDHIRTLFDGAKKGIPILSCVIALNDESEYVGGDFIFTEYPEFRYRLKKGHALIFPSVFCYKHFVSEVTNGIRYTAVAWSY